MKPLAHDKTFDVYNIWIVLSILTVWLIIFPNVHGTTFFDGLIYSSIARNISQGSPVWHPQFSETLFPIFSEHPPLMIFLESLIFRAAGDHFWVEKVVSAGLLLPTGLLMLKIWKIVCEDDRELIRLAPVALIFGLISGKFAWGFANNMLENALAPACYAAVCCGLLSISAASLPRRFLWLISCGLCITSAVMVKGPVGLFPISAIGLHWISRRQAPFLIAVRDTLIVILVVVTAIGCILLEPEAREYAGRYVQHQLLASLVGARGNDGGGAYAVWTLFRDTLYPMTISAGIVVVSRFWRFSNVASLPNVAERQSKAFYFLLLGLASSVPILLSPRVYSFYFNPSLPFFAASCALVAATPLARILLTFKPQEITWLRRLYLIILFGSAVIVISTFNQPGKDKTIIEDADKIAERLCPANHACSRRLPSCGSVGQDWQLHGYLQRRHKISLEIPVDGKPSSANFDFLLLDDSCEWKERTGYAELEIGLRHYRLWQKTPP